MPDTPPPTRPADPAPPKRIVTACVTPAEHQRVLDTATARGQSVNDLIRTALRDVLAPSAPKR